jgi:hypothetical protein
MNTSSACEDMMFAPAQLFDNCCEQWPSNKGDLDSGVLGGDWESLLHVGGPALVPFSYHNVIVVGLHLKSYTLNFS